jgi:hypothetical protein
MMLNKIHSNVQAMLAEARSIVKRRVQARESKDGREGREGREQEIPFTLRHRR